MLKKLLAILLIPVFLLTTGGIAINIHLCKMSGKADASLALNAEKSCCGEEDMDNDCCSNEVHFIKIKDDYSSISVPAIEKEISCILVPSLVFIYQPLPVSGTFVPNYHSPPPDDHVRLNILYRSILV